MFQYILSCFSSIWQYIKAFALHKITVIAAESSSCLGGSTQKNHVFKQPLNHNELD